MRWPFLFLCALVIPAYGATQWTRLSTPDFDLYTSSGEKAGKEILQHFEQVHGFFLRASPVREGADEPVRIVEFNSDKLIQPYRVNNYSPAWFTGAPDRDYIVLDDAERFEYHIAIHEYMHLIVSRSGLRLPVWVNEGWAEVYSTLRPESKGVAVGDLIEGRMNELATHQWLSFAALTAVDNKSPEYNEAAQAGIFYAESWALVHMLYLAPEYQANFGKFIVALSQGKTAAEAVRIAWDRTPDEVYSDLRNYFDRKKIFGRVFEAPLPRGAAEPVVAVLNDFDAALMLADLASASGKREAARQAYAKLAAEQPNRPDLARSMGYLALEEHDDAAARRYFSKAFDAGDADPRMCYRLAQLDLGAREQPARVIAELNRALASRPDMPEARLELGIEEIAARRFDDGIATLVALKTVSSARAPAVYCGLTYARIEIGDLETARTNLETCRRWSKTDRENAEANEYARLLNARMKPEVAVRPNEHLQSVNGVARNLVCSSEGNRLQVQVGDRLVSFDLPEPDAVELTRSSGTTFDFVCGPQRPFSLMLDFAPPRSAIETSAGIIRRMEF